MNEIGLKVEESHSIAKDLNVLLANYQVFYINVRGFHWNIKGDKFFELHAKFEELYNDALVKIDEIAERIQTLGETPLHAYSDYLRHSAIVETKNISDGKEAAQQIVSSLKQLVSIERKLLTDSEETGDEGTNSMVSDYIREQEKMIWMYTAFLS